MNGLLLGRFVPADGPLDVGIFVAGEREARESVIGAGDIGITLTKHQLRKILMGPCRGTGQGGSDELRTDP